MGIAAFSHLMVPALQTTAFIALKGASVACNIIKISAFLSQESPTSSCSGSCWEPPSPGKWLRPAALLAVRHRSSPRIQRRWMLGQCPPQKSKLLEYTKKTNKTAYGGANAAAPMHCTLSLCLQQLCPSNTVPGPARAGGPGHELSGLLCLLGWAVQE